MPMVRPMPILWDSDHIPCPVEFIPFLNIVKVVEWCRMIQNLHKSYDSFTFSCLDSLMVCSWFIPWDNDHSLCIVKLILFLNMVKVVE